MPLHSLQRPAGSRRSSALPDGVPAGVAGIPASGRRRFFGHCCHTGDQRLVPTGGHHAMARSPRDDVSGAIVGDGVSFWLGHRYHEKIVGLWPLNRNPALKERSEAFFTRHGNKSVFLARFIPGVRAFIPLFAGIAGMSSFRFYIASSRHFYRHRRICPQPSSSSLGQPARKRGKTHRDSDRCSRPIAR